jgi:hypothetical protein
VRPNGRDAVAQRCAPIPLSIQAQACNADDGSDYGKIGNRDVKVFGLQKKSPKVRGRGAVSARGLIYPEVPLAAWHLAAPEVVPGMRMDPLTLSRMP